MTQQEYVINSSFLIKRGFAKDWEKLNPVLRQGEIGFIIDENAIKIGDGVTLWNALSIIGDDEFSKLDSKIREELEKGWKKPVRFNKSIAIGSAEASGENSFAMGEYEPFSVKNGWDYNKEGKSDIRRLTKEEAEKLYEYIGVYYEYVSLNDNIEDDYLQLAIYFVDTNQLFHITESVYIDWCLKEDEGGANAHDFFNIKEDEVIDTNYNGPVVYLYGDQDYFESDIRNLTIDEQKDIFEKTGTIYQYIDQSGSMPEQQYITISRPIGKTIHVTESDYVEIEDEYDSSDFIDGDVFNIAEGENIETPCYAYGCQYFKDDSENYGHLKIQKLTDTAKELVYNKTGKYYEYIELTDEIEDNSTPTIELYDVDQYGHIVAQSEYIEISSGFPVTGRVFNIEDSTGFKVPYEGIMLYKYCPVEMGIDLENYETTAIASGELSFAQGRKVVASGTSSHAEGYFTTASGTNSHAEGYSTTASGANSHAEGYNTEASGTSSHAEGQNTAASGYRAHAEGNYTIASGYASHAEGNYTIARGRAQHVQGRYNIEDTINQHAFIIGNGTSESERSNAFTVDWNGDTKMAGWMDTQGLRGNTLTRNLYVGGAKDLNGDWQPRSPFIVDYAEKNPTKNQAFVSTMQVPKQGIYWLTAPNGSNYIYKIRILYANNSTKTFDINSLPTSTAGQYGDYYEYNYNGFTAIFGNKTRVDSSSKQFSDGTWCYKRFNMQNSLNYQDDNLDMPYPAIKFETDDAATIIVWWVAGDANRPLVIQTDENGGSSRLEVSGNFIAHGNAEFNKTVQFDNNVNIAGRLETKDIHVDGFINTNESIECGGNLKVDGEARIKGDLDLKGEDEENRGNIKNVQAIDVYGTAKFLNDVRIKNNTNRDYTLKLSDVLNEALDYGFKSRVYVNEMNGATFTEKLQNAINEVNDGGTICIPSGNYVLAMVERQDIIRVNKSITLLGVGKEKPTINCSIEHSYSEIIKIENREDKSENPIIFTIQNINFISENTKTYRQDLFAAKTDYTPVEMYLTHCNITGEGTWGVAICFFSCSSIKLNNCNLQHVFLVHGNEEYSYWGSTTLEITDSQIFAMDYTIECTGARKIYIKNSILESDDSYAINGYKSDSVIIVDSEVYSNSDDASKGCFFNTIKHLCVEHSHIDPIYAGSINNAYVAACTGGVAAFNPTNTLPNINNLAMIGNNFEASPEQNFLVKTAGRNIPNGTAVIQDGILQIT